MPDYQFLLIHSFYTTASEAKGSYSAGLTSEPPDNQTESYRPTITSLCFPHGRRALTLLVCLPQSPRVAVPVLTCPGFTLSMLQSISQQSYVPQKPSRIFCPQITLWKLVKWWPRFGVLSINFNVYWRMTWSQAKISGFGPAFPGPLVCHGVELAGMQVKGSRGGGVSSWMWPQEWTELWSEWGIHNTGKEGALFHPLSPSQLHMSWITVHKSSGTLLLLCSASLLPVLPRPEPSPPCPLSFLTTFPLHPFSQWLLKNLLISYLRTLSEGKILEDHDRKQNSTEKKKIMNYHLGPRVHSMNCQECFKSNPNIYITNDNHIITDFLHYPFPGRKYSVVHGPIKQLFCNIPSLWYHLLLWRFQEHENLLGHCHVWRKVGCSTQSVSEASPFNDSTDNALRESMDRRDRSSGSPAITQLLFYHTSHLVKHVLHADWLQKGLSLVPSTTK